MEHFIHCHYGFKPNNCSKVYYNCCSFWYSASFFNQTISSMYLQTVVSTAQPSGCINGMKLTWGLSVWCGFWVIWAKISSKLKENFRVLAKTHLHAVFSNQHQLRSVFMLCLTASVLSYYCFTWWFIRSLIIKKNNVH